MSRRRSRSSASAAKRSGRGTEEGVIASYVHADGRKGALVEVQSETDFVARNEDFQEFARQVAIHVTAMNPEHVSFEDIPEEEVADERRILEERARAEGIKSHQGPLTIMYGGSPGVQVQVPAGR